MKFAYAAAAMVLFAQAGLLCHRIVTPPKQPLWPLHLSFTDSRCGPESVEDDSDGPWSSHHFAPSPPRCLSSPLVVTKPYILLRYAGDPSGGSTVKWIDSEGTSLPMRLPRAARHGWLMTSVFVPEGWRNRPVRLQIDAPALKFDKPRVVVDAMAESVAAAVTAAPLASKAGDALRAIFATVFVLVPWLQRKVPLRLIYLAWAAAASLIYLRHPSFYHWDDYALLERFARPQRWQDFLAYNGHFEPAFLLLYASAVRWAHDCYGPLQIFMVLGHALTATLLFRFLRGMDLRQGPCLAASALYLSAWVHVDVTPWFMEASFLCSALVCLASLICLQGESPRPTLAAAYSAAACAFFSGGAMVPVLDAMFVGLRWGRRQGWPWAAVFTLEACAAVALNAATQSSLHASSTSIRQVIGFVGAGALHGAWSTYLGLRGATGLGAALLLGCVCLGWGPHKKVHWSMIFALFWLFAAYLLPAAGRASLGVKQAASFRYAYFGMLPAALLLALGTQQLRGRWTGLVALVFAAVLVQTNHRRALKRLDSAEAEYFAIDRQYFELTRLAGPDACGQALQPVPKTLVSGWNLGRYGVVLPLLDRQWPHQPTAETCAALTPFLTAPQHGS